MAGPHTYTMQDAADTWTSRHPDEDADPKVLENLSLDKLTEIVNESAKTNAELRAEAIAHADSRAFYGARPEFLSTPENVRVMNHWLKAQNIEDATFADFDAAFHDLSSKGLLELNEDAAIDWSSCRTFRSPSGKTYESVDDLIAAERTAALQNLRVEATPEEQAINALPLEDFQRLMRGGEQHVQRTARIAETQADGDAWISVNAWYTDNARNANLMKMQLEANGVSTDAASFEQFEIAARQLREAGLLTVNQKAATKEHAAELQQRAAKAMAKPGSTFDKTQEDEDALYAMPMEELYRRGGGRSF